MSYFNSPTPNLASPLIRKTIDHCKSYILPMKVQKSQKGINVENMQLFLHLSAAGCLNTEKLEVISIGARTLGLAS
jgi:hypothetical protein